jgi:hypothetical protein
VRKIFVQEPDSDTWKKWIQDCQEETKKAIDSVAKGDKPIINESLYKQKNIKDSYFVCTDSPPFYGRCAYCETPIADTQYVDIEHFRPKGGIKDEHGNVVNLKDENGIDKGKNHFGYYWLAYDWQNLLPACEICNRRYKSTIFPVIGKHAQLPNEEVNEKPLLINPISELEEDDPENHLAVDTETGIMYAVNGSRRGEMCIKLFNLNNRKHIIESRKHKQERIASKILDLRLTCAEIPNPDRPRKETYAAIIKKCDYFIDIFKGKEAYTAASISELKKKYSIEFFQKLRKEFEDLLSKLDG